MVNALIIFKQIIVFCLQYNVLLELLFCYTQLKVCFHEPSPNSKLLFLRYIVYKLVLYFCITPI